jgi:hypothetical protein
MSPKNSRTLRPFTIALIVLVVVLSLILCAALLFLFTLTNQETLLLTAEAGSPLPAASEFFSGNKQDALYTGGADAVSMDKPGDYPLTISQGFFSYDAVLQVRDTIAPTATVTDATVINPSEVNADRFVSDIRDATHVTSFLELSPDALHAGEHTVTVVLKDLGGNETRLQAKLTVIIDSQAPTITGVRDLLTYVGGTVAYRAGVTVSDDYDENVKLELDTSGVDLSTAGVYTVLYRAADASGNLAEQKAQVTVLEKRENHVELDVIYAEIDKQLAKFITDDMTDRQKAEAVYVWTRLHFTYGGHTDTTDYIQSAYQFLKTRKGDCFGYFALQKLMLERMNIPTIDVYKVKNYPSDSNHYWLLVSIDGGENYYHYDNVWSKYLCLVTDKRLNAFSKSVKNCFNRDESLYPATPTEDLPNVNKLPWNDPKIVNATP